MRCVVCGAMMMWAILCGVSNRAHADQFKRGTKVHESQHRVEIRVVDGVAHYKVRRAFVNPGTLHIQEEVVIDLPAGASVVGLRLLLDGTAYEASHMSHGDALGIYEQPAGDLDAREVRPRALMSWSGGTRKSLRLYPVPPGETLTVEYDVVAPAAYRDGAYHFRYPKPEDEEGEDTSFVMPSILILSSESDQRASFLGRRLEPGEVLRPIPRDLRAMELCNAKPMVDVRCHVMQARVEAEFPRPGVFSATLDVNADFSDDVMVMWVSPNGQQHELEVQMMKGGRIHAKLASPVALASGVWSLLVLDSSSGRQLDVQQATMSVEGKQLARLGRAYIQHMERPLLSEDYSADSQLQLTLSASHRREEPHQRYAVLHHDTHSAIHMSLNLPVALTTIPDELDVSIVVDNSRSMELLEHPSDLWGNRDEFEYKLGKVPAGQHDRSVWAMIRAFGEHAPQTTFDVITFDRDARGLFPEPVKGAQLSRSLHDALKHTPVDYRNGSNLEQGVRLANARLASSSHHTRRILVLTDEILPPDWVSSRKIGELADGVMIQVVRLSDDADTSLEVVSEQDATDFGRHVQHLGGVYFKMTLNTFAYAMVLGELSLGLLRPTTLDLIETDHPQFTSFPRQLKEGQGLAVTRLMDGHEAPERWTVNAMLWATPVELVFETSRASEAIASGLLLGHKDVKYHVDKGFEEVLASRSGAVSRHHSLLAVKRAKGAARGAPIMSHGGMGTMGFSTTSTTSCGGAMGAIVPAKVELTADLFTDVITTCASSTGVKTWSGQLDVSRTYHELIEVEVSGTNPAFEACVSEGVWGVRLDQDTFKTITRSRSSWGVALSGSKLDMVDL